MKGILPLSIILLLFADHIFAQTLTALDLTFASNGIYSNDTGSYTSIVIQPDDKIIALGGNKAYVTRFNINGIIDNSFADSGYFSISFPKPPAPYPAYPSLNSICLQADGKILLGGKVDTVYTNASNPNGGDYNFLLIRLNANGNLDSSFGGSGYVITSYHPYHPLGNSAEWISSIALQPDGKIIALGNSNLDTMVVLRYQTNGSLDSGFGNAGKAQLIGDFGYPQANDIAVLPNGKIIVGATTKIYANGKYCFTVLRLLTDGSLDTSFNHTGMAYADISSNWLSYCKSMRVQPDGKILLAGNVDSITVVRFDTSGTLDDSFSGDGMVKLWPGSSNALVLQPGGKILVGGSSADTSFFLCRLLNSGSLDPTFGNQGLITTKILYEKNIINGIGLQTDGKILCGGESESFPWPNNYSLAVMVRYLPNATGVEEIKISKHYFNFYPNPVSDNLQISYLNDEAITVNLTVYDITGRKMLSQGDLHFQDSYIDLNVSRFSSGVYFINLYNNKGVREQFKFLKQ